MQAAPAAEFLYAGVKVSTSCHGVLSACVLATGALIDLITLFAHIRGRVAWQTALAADLQLLPTPVPRPRPAPSRCKTHAEVEIGCRAVRAAWGIPQWTVTAWTVFLRCAEWLAPLISCFLWSTWACRHSPTAGPHSSAAAAATAYGLPPLPRRRRCGRHRRTSALSHGCQPAGGKNRAAGA